MKKIFALILSLAMIATMFAGCSDEFVDEESAAKSTILFETEGDFVITKIEAVAYAGSSNGVRRFTYLITLQSDEVGVIVETSGAEYIVYEVGDIVSGHFVVKDNGTFEDEMKFTFKSALKTYSALYYIDVSDENAE